MPKKEIPLQTLGSFIPDGSLEDVIYFLNRYDVHLTITKERKTVLGDYRNKHSNLNHRISVNKNLNKYAFLITLLHELAHLLAFEKYGHTIQPHGREWKNEFAFILDIFIKKQVFPNEIKKVLIQSLHNPAASSCADTNLIRVLRNFDKDKNEVLLENISIGKKFTISGGRVFEKGEQVRKRFKCKEVDTGKVYLFSPVYMVKPLPE